ncbi:MAG: hypothetical protein L0211_15630 [Planctomycetaceae bacterium]|nr:hypothetical protein [Planctomycetaceae bacterium]
MRSVVVCAALVVAASAHAESLPSFHLPRAVQAAKSIIVVEDGKIAEVWAGDAKVGTPHGPEAKRGSINVVYGWRPVLAEDDKLIDQELAKKGLKRVGSVSGKRMVFFNLSEPYRGIAQMLSRDRTYTTVWLEDGQAFAIQQWMNPGPADMRSLDMTEAELKQAVLDLREVGQKVAKIDEEEDDAKRSAALVALLKPGNRWWNDEVKAALRIRSKQAWPAIEPLIRDEKYLPLHGELIRLAYEFAKADARPLFETVLAAENEYFRQLDVARTKYDREKPPHLYHEQRRSAAQWAIDSSQ